MKFEVLKQSHLKKNIIIGVVAVLIISALILNFTRAKYKVTESIPLVNGTINYSLADLNIVALYIDGVEAEELDSTKSYTLDTTQSTCTYKDGSTIDNLTLSYDSSTKSFSISPYTTRGTKCTLYFREIKTPTNVLELIASKNIVTRTDFSTILTEDTTGVIYQAEDDFGTTYYFAGAPTDNWVYFGGFYWRIVRINGNNSIRLIYQGKTGEETYISRGYYNDTFYNNMYVGYMYTSGSAHGIDNDSAAKKTLDTWYSNNMLSYADKIDTEAGFCNDRTTYSGSGINSVDTHYSGYSRLYLNKAPSFKCTNQSDLFTTASSSKGNHALIYPIGLITADEISYAGGLFQTSNTEYYLYSSTYYWTMTPHSYNNDIGEAMIFFGGPSLNYYFAGSSLENNFGVRSVINLKADVTISSGDGTMNNPYVVN